MLMGVFGANSGEMRFSPRLVQLALVWPAHTVKGGEKLIPNQNIAASKTL